MKILKGNILLFILCIAFSTGMLRDTEAAVFCPEDWSKKACAQPNNRDYLLRKGELIDRNPSDFIRRAKRAAVRVEKYFYKEKDPYTCAATVVKLKRNGETCPNNILLTAGHCFIDKESKRSVKKAYFFRNPKKKANMNVYKIETLKTDCVTNKYTKRKDDCFVGNTGSGVTDQALIPLITYSLPQDVEPLEIEINNVLTSSEMDSCIKSSETKKLNMVSLLHEDHFEFYDTKYPNLINKRIFALKCSSKKEDVALETSKKVLNNICPTLAGKSGSFINFSCGRREKKGIFVHKAARSTIKTPHHYEESYKRNIATHITKDLLNRAFERFCK